MMFTLFILYFLFFSLIGWILDSTYSSLYRKRFINSGYFWELPLCPIYGFGGVALILLTQYLQGYPFVAAIVISGLMLTTIEYIGGIFCVFILKERLWDYSDHRWNIHGHIDVFHSICWILLSIIFYFFLYPLIVQIHNSFQRATYITPLLDRTIFFLFCFIAFIYTAKRRDTRLNTLVKKTKKRNRYSK